MAFKFISPSRPSSTSLKLFSPTSLFFRCCSNQSVADKPDNAAAKTMSVLINSRPWTSGLQSFLAQFAPAPSEAVVLQTLTLINDSSKALMFLEWARGAGFYPDQRSFFLLLEILGRSGNLRAARELLFSIEKASGGSVRLEDKFFNSVIRSYGRAGFVHESLKLFEAMKSLGVSPSAVTFNSLFSILLKRGRTCRAWKLYDEMLATYGVSPDTFTFNVLIRGFCANSMVDVGFRFFQEMERFNCEPDVITYNTLVDGLCRAGKVEIARKVVNGMGKNNNQGLIPNVVTYTTLIRGYCMKREFDEALLVFKVMTGRGLKPNMITFNTLLNGLSEANKITEMKEVMEGADFVPDTCTFNTLIHSHCWAGKLDEAMKVFAKMSELKIQKDSATYSVLIGSLCQEGNFGKAEDLFDELAESGILLGDSGCRPLVAPYNPIFEHLCRNGRTNKAERVFRQLMKRGVQDPPSYKTMIMGHCRDGTFDAAKGLLVSMLRRGFVPDSEVYGSLINGLLKTGKFLHAYSTLENMVKSSHRPNASTFHNVLAKLIENGFAKQSLCVVALMLENKVRQDITLSTKLLELLFSSRMQDEAFRLLGSIYENGYIVKIEVLAGLLCQSSKLLEAYKLLQFGLPRHQNIDLELINKVISGLCENGFVSEAFGLYYEMVERGVHEHLRCLKDLKTALEVAGKSSEAKFVSKRINPKEQHHCAAPFKVKRSKESEVRDSNVSPLVIKHRKLIKTEWKVLDFYEPNSDIYKKKNYCEFKFM